MPPLSLRELQGRFAASLASGGSDHGVGIYRHTIAVNYRQALAATFPVTRKIAGAARFEAAAAEYGVAHPSTGGDLNVFGDALPAFLGTYAGMRDLPLLPDMARLEWALDEAQRAADCATTAADLLAAIGAVPPEAIARLRFALHPSCRLVTSPHPLMRTWREHQDDGFAPEDVTDGPDRLLVRREGGMPVIERLDPGTFAFLETLARGDDLSAALDAALRSDAAFDLETSLRTLIAGGTLAALA